MQNGLQNGVRLLTGVHSAGNRRQQINKETYEATVERLREVNAVVKTLDEAIRAEAFGILRPYIDGKSTGKPKRDLEGQDVDTGDTPQDEPADTSSAEAFVRSQDIDKPANAVKAIAAWWFSQYGSAPMKAADIKRLAGEIGVTIPNNPYMTLVSMKSDGKDVFRASKGDLVPTVPHGELLLQNQYKVKKGKKQRPEADSK